MVNRDRVVKKKYICYECGSYFRVKTNNRIRMVADIFFLYNPVTVYHLFAFRTFDFYNTIHIIFQWRKSILLSLPPFHLLLQLLLQHQSVPLF